MPWQQDLVPILGAIGGLGGRSNAFMQRWQELEAQDQQRQQQEQQTQRQTMLDDRSLAREQATDDRAQQQLMLQAETGRRADEQQRMTYTTNLQRLFTDESVDPDVALQLATMAPPDGYDLGAIQSMHSKVFTASERQRRAAAARLKEIEADPQIKKLLEAGEDLSTVSFTVPRLGANPNDAEGRPLWTRGELMQMAQRPVASTPLPKAKNAGAEYIGTSRIIKDVPLDRQHAAAIASGDTELVAQLEQSMRQQDATRRDPPRQPIQVTVGGSGLTQSQISAAAGLRDDFRTESKDFLAARDGYERLLASAEDTSPAGDVALLYGFMKILDPNSVVRETEFATAARTGSLPQQIQAAAERVVNGQRLTREQRADFVNRARSLFGRAQNRQNTRRENYKRIAKDSGVPEGLVILEDPPVDESVIGGTPSSAGAGGRAVGPNPFRR